MSLRQVLDTPPSTRASTSTPSSHGPLTPSTPDLCNEKHALYCFEVLTAHFEGREPEEPEFDNADEPFALFVTWNTSSHLRPNKKPALRGCIGNFTPMPLAKGLREYALVSALEDRRFSPIRKDELSSLSCSVSLLTPFTPVPSPLAWTPGIHGIHITFPDPTSKRTLSATYLPEVASEQGWSREETIFSAIQKAGYKYKVTVGDQVWESLKVKVYGSSKAAVGWNEYVAWKKGK